VFSSSLQYSCETFLIPRRIQRDTAINVHKSLRTGIVILVRKLNNIFRQIFEKYFNMKFHENPGSGTRVASCGRPDGQTDRQAGIYDETNSCFSQFF